MVLGETEADTGPFSLRQQPPCGPTFGPLTSTPDLKGVSTGPKPEPVRMVRVTVTPAGASRNSSWRNVDNDYWGRAEQ